MFFILLQKQISNWDYFINTKLQNWITNPLQNHLKIQPIFNIVCTCLSSRIIFIQRKQRREVLVLFLRYNYVYLILFSIQHTFDNKRDIAKFHECHPNENKLAHSFSDRWEWIGARRKRYKYLFIEMWTDSHIDYNHESIVVRGWMLHHIIRIRSKSPINSDTFRFLFKIANFKIQTEHLWNVFPLNFTKVVNCENWEYMYIKCLAFSESLLRIHIKYLHNKIYDLRYFGWTNVCCVLLSFLIFRINLNMPNKNEMCK